MRWGILLGIMLVLIVIPIASADLIVVEGDDAYIYTNFSSHCYWNISEPMRQCYHNFTIVPKIANASVDVKLKFDHKDGTQVVGTDLDPTSKLKTSISENTTYTINFTAPPNYAEKFNFSVKVEGKWYEVDPDISACSTLNSAGARYELTANVSTAATYCMYVAAANITLDGNGFWLINTGAGDRAFRLQSGSDHFLALDINIKDFAYIVRDEYGTNQTFYNMTVTGIDTRFSDINLNGVVFDLCDLNSIDDGFDHWEGGICGGNYNVTNSRISWGNTSGDNAFKACESSGTTTALFVNNTFHSSSECAIDPYFRTGMRFINNTFEHSGVVGCGNMNGFVGTVVNEFSGNIVNVTGAIFGFSGTKYDDQWKMNNSDGGNYYYNQSGDGFSDTCTCTDGFCDETYTIPSGATHNETDYAPRCGLGAEPPYQENIVIALTSPTGDIITASSVFLIAFNSNATANYSYIIVNATTVQNNSVNGTSWSLNYQTGLLLRESAGYNVTVTACSYYNNSVCDTESIYIDFEYSSGNLLLVIVALVAMAILLLGFYRLYDAGKKGKMGEVLNEIVIYICMMFMLALFTLFL